MTGFAEFTDPRLVSLYDVANPPGPDTTFFLSLPVASDRMVLDVGCGTGLLAVEYSRAGLGVVGVDPAPEMLRVARHRAGGDSVEWVEASAAAFDHPQRFDLAVMTSHVFQFLLDDHAAISALENVRGHLNDGGRLAFESRNPLDRAWERWTRDHTFRTITHPELGAISHWVEVEEQVDDVATFTLYYEGQGFTATSENRLRFPSRESVLTQLERADFTIESAYGDWDRSPLTAASPEIIVVAKAGS